MKIRILLLCSILCLSFILSGCGAESNANKLATFAEQSFLEQDYESYIQTLRETSGLNDLTATINISYDFDYDYDKKNNWLNAVCYFSFSSDEIDKYATAEYYTPEANELATTLHRLSKALANTEPYQYTSSEGSVRLKVNWPRFLKITTSNEHEYELVGEGSVYVTVDGEWVYDGYMPVKKNNKTSSATSNSSTSQLPNTARHTDVDAWVCAQNIVKSNLKSPSTANFCSYPDATITHLGNGEYKVTGWVEAQNSLGATLRQNFVVTYTATEKGYKNGIAIIG